MEQQGEAGAASLALGLRLNECEDKLQTAQATLDEAVYRVHEQLRRTYAARAEARRRGAPAQLEAARQLVTEGMATLFVGGSGGGAAASPQQQRQQQRQPPPPLAQQQQQQQRKQPTLRDVEARVLAESDVAQNGHSLACCMRVSSERLYLAWGRLVFGTLCWWYAIRGEGGEGAESSGGEEEEEKEEEEEGGGAARRPAAAPAAARRAQ
jgi:hypothetical protein